MKILFLSSFYDPHIGGVERHVASLCWELVKKGHNLTVITEKFDRDLKTREKIGGVIVNRFSYPRIKILGLFIVWYRLWKFRSLIKESDIVHCHDVFIWYLPFRFLFPKKSVYTTFHGLEWDNPLARTSILQKRLAFFLSNGTIGVGRFLEKYLKVKFSVITYGASILPRTNRIKKENKIVYVGRLEENTGLIKFLRLLDRSKKYKVDFCGDGRLRVICQRYGVVHGFCDPLPFLKVSKYCVPGGYLAALEALNEDCKLKIFWNNNVKEDYWKMSPFMDKNVYSWARSQTWKNMADLYLKLWEVK